MTEIELLGIILAVVGIVLTIIFGLPALLPWISDKIPEIKKINYWLINKKIKIKINSVKKYPIFSFSMPDLLRAINQKLVGSDKRIENSISGNNYIELLLEGTQAPFRIILTPDISEVSTSERVSEQLEVSIRLVGTINFYYRDDRENREYINIIDDMYQTIEQKYSVKPTFENHSIKSTITDFIESWDVCSTKQEDGTIIRIGKKILDVNAKQLIRLYDVYKKNIPNI